MSKRKRKTDSNGIEELSFVEEYERLMKHYNGSGDQNIVCVPEEWVGLVNKFENSILSLSGEGYNRMPNHDDDDSMECFEEDDENKKKVRQICLHMVHVVSMLTWKYKSLQNGIAALQDWTVATTANNFDSSQFLEGWFHHYLRLSDGLHLLHSGECRHEGDIRHVARSVGKHRIFLTRLTQGGKRQDGYTQLYDSSKVYSGYGWDEYYNETLGLRTRLFRILSSNNNNFASKSKKKKIQKQLSRTIEIVLDQIDLQIRSCQQALVKLMERHKHDSKIKIVKLSLVDKMEQLTYYHNKKEDKNEPNTKNKITLQRPPNFTIQNDAQHLGALPNHWSKTQWLNSFNTILNLTSRSEQRNNNINPKNATAVASKKVKRRIIVESDDDDDDIKSEDEVIVNTGKESQIKQNKVNISDCGFRKKEDNVEKNNGFSSLLEIKNQLGIDAIHLEQSRAALEKEQQDETKNETSDNIEQESKEKIAQLQEEILQEKQQVSMYKQILQIANRNSNTNDIWDASESLRSSFMTLGNQLLDLHELIDINRSSVDAHLEKRKKSLLRGALNYFKSSIPLVNKLQQMNKNMKNTGEVEYKCRLVALWLCLGRAHVNAGRTECDLFTPKSNPEQNENNPFYKSILSHFKEALDCSQKMITAYQNYPSSNQTVHSIYASIKNVQGTVKQTIIEANELTSTVNRWKGYFLWQCHKQDEAITILQSASGMNDSNMLFSYDHYSKSDESITDAFILFLVQCYAGTSLLLNNITICFHHYTETSLLHSTNKYESIEIWYTIALKGFNHAHKILEKLATITASLNQDNLTSKTKLFTELVEEHHLDNPSILKESKNFLTQTWREIQEKKKQQLQKKSSFQKQSHIFLPTNSFPNKYQLLNTKKHQPYRGRIFVTNVHGHKDQTHQQQKRLINEEAVDKFNDDTFDNFGLQTGLIHNFSDSSHGNCDWEINFVTKKAYRPWGDELLSDPKAFPACAPPIPDEMKQQFEKEMN